MPSEWKFQALSILSILIGVIAFIPKENRLLAGLVFAAAIILYILNSFSSDIDEYGDRIQKLEEKLKIHEQLVTMKSDIEHLKKEVRRK